jgi:sec-independent protein translocase protein TatC
MSQKTAEELNQQSTTLTGHLRELRFRLVRSLWATLLGMAICYNFTEKIFDVIRAPIAPYLQGGGLIFTGPMDKFVAHLKLAFFGGVILAFPYLASQIWAFVAPGLYAREKKYGLSFIVSGSILFALGILFSYFVVFPMAFKFLMTYGGDVDKPMISIGEYMSFFVTTSIGFGAAFELPLIIILLSMFGIVSHKFLKEKRRYAIMGIAVVAAVITPPDLLSMVMMLAPMVALYEIATIIVGIMERKRKPDANLPAQT